MDHLKVWVESHSRSRDEGAALTSSTTSNGFRPPSLRTSSTYDNDETFNKVALNLLSWHEGLNLSVQETIMAILLSPRERSSFFEGMHIRLSRSAHFSPSTASLVQTIESKFGTELKQIVEEESGEKNLHPFYNRQESSDSLPPTTPRHIRSNSSVDSSEPSISATGSKHTSNRRRFFSETTPGPASFFRAPKVRNLDWKLTETIEQVQSLRLDGTFGLQSRSGRGEYQPPSPLARLSL
jgi:hypothetical protein